MRHRITYIRETSAEFDPDALGFAESTVYVGGLSAAKEHKVTLEFPELPSELTAVLDQCHELHIRWTSPLPYESPIPYVSRITPGLYVQFTPAANGTGRSLCPALQFIFDEGIKCTSPEESFTIPSAPLNAASRHYYSYVPSLASLVLYLQQTCPRSNSRCQEAAFSLLLASYLDIDYDSKSQKLTLAPFWDKETLEGAWNEKITKEPNDRIEVGILKPEPAREREDLRVSGWLVVVGDDKEPKPTLFSFPSRHHPLPGNGSHTPSYSTSFQEPTSLHPTLLITLTHADNLAPPHPSCELHTYFMLPSTLFIDKHQFIDTLFLSSHNLLSLDSLSGATDLEAPEYAVTQWGSNALFKLLPPHASRTRPGDDWGISIPLHLRYLTPVDGGYTNLTIPYPIVFWACTAEQDEDFNTNPFDRVNLGFDALFDKHTMFYHLEPSAKPASPAEDLEPLTVKITVPVLDLRRSGYVEVGTILVVLAGFLWIGWKLFGPLGSRKERRKTKMTKMVGMDMAKKRA